MAGYSRAVEDDILMVAADDPRTVSYYRRTGTDTFAAAATVTGAVRLDVQGSPLSAAGLTLQPDTTTYLLQAKQLGYTPPRPGDRVTEGSDAWSVNSVGVLGENTWYSLAVLKEV